jgi:saccharopine dehydrogenase (NAD+, L-lysine-forming)
MLDLPHLWIRHETRQTETRAPIIPSDARILVDAGLTVTVEESAQRVFPVTAYQDAGCRIAPPGSWPQAPAECVIVGLKELPVLPAALSHRHLYFGHAYKGQEGAQGLLDRFEAGGGVLLDLEFLVDDTGRRLASFGHWAGYVGAALSVLRLRDRLDLPLRPYSKDALDAVLRPGPGDRPIRALVMGAEGRCGGGARAALTAAEVQATCWDIAETRNLDRHAVLDHDVLINAVSARAPIPPFLVRHDLDQAGRRLSLICDVSCDVTSEFNALPIYQRVTSWPDPVLRLRGGDRPLDIIAIDNLPSLLPLEASVAFSTELTPLLLPEVQGSPTWQRCADAFRDAGRSFTDV